jgi:hypothetical protein
MSPEQMGITLMITQLYRALLSRFLKVTFRFWQHLGIHITRCHFYEAIPDTRTLRDGLWQHYSKLIGVNFDEKAQLDLLSHFRKAFKGKYDRFPMEKTSMPCEYYIKNGIFESVDGEILYCMIGHFRPRRIIEIGSGYSTYLAAKAILNNQKDNHDYLCDLTAIEPFPNKILQKGFPGLSRLVQKPVQEVPYSKFEKLRDNDMLLIDSSHVLKIDSDVQYLYLEVLPRLDKGVLISFHDIFLPAPYRKEWVLKNHWFWNEQYLLQAFLTFNSCFEILWMGSYMHLMHSEELRSAFSSYDKERDWPGSFWIRKVK